MEIHILDTQVSLPVDLMGSKSNSNIFPEEIAKFLKKQKIWHLIAWNDKHNGAIGFARKGGSHIIQKNEMESVQVAYMTRAKGPGFVSLEVKLKNAGIASILGSNLYSEEAVSWLKSKTQSLSDIFECEINFEDFGPDY